MPVSDGTVDFFVYKLGPAIVLQKTVKQEIYMRPGENGQCSTPC